MNADTTKKRAVSEVINQLFTTQCAICGLVELIDDSCHPENAPSTDLRTQDKTSVLAATKTAAAHLETLVREIDEILRAGGAEFI